MSPLLGVKADICDPSQRLAALSCSVLDDRPNAVSGLLALVAVTGLLARSLPRDERETMASALAREAYGIDTARLN